ncbi:M3 family metallopeptidase [Propioniciclava sinopodophylli]|uniref:M3 family metallopeptidase n=1 Tax=Propioniciclava sinopodophylli TaxID=1837344 RepID=UPI0024938A85|nr:M3 family metallopeptidase [Propioniciclava sinopodophylli]
MTDPAPLTLPAADAYLPWVTASTESLLADARAKAEAIKTSPPATALATLEAWNELDIALGNLSARGELFSEVHPDACVREAAEQAALEARKLSTELGLDTELYAVFAGLDADGLDAQATRLLEKTLRSFRRSGVAADETTRARIKEIRDRLTVLGQTFARTIREGTRSIKVTPDQLAGLPADWIEAHPAGEDGLVTVTTDYPDAIPFRTFAHDETARHDLLVASLTIGYPDNVEVLREMFGLRAELATLLGYDTFPDFDAEVKMIKSGAAIGEFIDKIADAALEPARRDVAILLERLRQDRPDADRVQSWDSAYYAELVRKEQHDVDAQLVRTYFDFGKVRDGLLAVTGRLFGLTYTPADVPVWHPSVTAYDVTRTDDGAAQGRIYLDLHPREGKFKHAAQFTLTNGVAGRQLPEGTLVCNFPTGLMEHDDVVTLFHEFGHLVHHLVGGHQRWAEFSGVATEWDFVEAPSQMLEEWAWDADVLGSFATNEAGEAIPAALVERMRKADDFGKGYFARTQMFYAALAYRLHLENPEDLVARTRELQEQYSLFPWVEGTCMPTSFGHLDGYNSGYYTYMWSLVIAKDMFSAFDADDLFDPAVATRYRDVVLAQGGTKDAADLVEEFLGRPYDFDAYAAWLAE